jgi:phosphatidylinositol-3-phosphatase
MEGTMPRALRYASAIAGVCLITVLLVVPRLHDGSHPSKSAGDPVARTTPSSGQAALHRISTVFIILMENKNWSQIKGSVSAPYINHRLLPQASYAEQYYNPPGLHPSLPNYLWLEAGTNFGIYDDNDPSAHSMNTTAHLVTLLKNAGISWKSYQENITGTACPLANAYPYAVKHNPQAYFDDVTNHDDPHSAYCIAHERPLTKLATDLAKNKVAHFSFITPNVCNDMHDSCAPVHDMILQGDTWLANHVPAILASQAFRQGGVLFITWDEAEAGDGPIGMIVLSPFAKGHGYASSIHYTHSSTLRTLETIFGVHPFLGDAARSTDLRDLFRAFP